MSFGIPRRMEDDRRKDGQSFYCPSGHSNSYGKGENARLKDELNSARIREQLERDQKLAAERELQKLKERTKNGSCPCCKRSFRNLQRHIATKHPEFAKK